MEQLFVTILTRIAERVTELSRIDEDYGQLEMLASGGDDYPLTFPAVLVGAPVIEWSALSAQSMARQTGIGTVVVKLVQDCYDDTHVGSGTLYLICQRCNSKSK